MSNSRDDSDDQSSNGGASITVRGLTASHIGMYAIQGFAIFAAFTSLLGRIYLREYSSALSIPESEFQIDDVLAYALISPDMAISGVGVALVSVVAVIALTRRVRPIQSRWRTLLSGLGLILINLLILWVYSGNDGKPESSIGALGIWWLIYSASVTLGTALSLSALASFIPDTPIDDQRAKSSCGAKSKNWRDRMDEAGRIFFPTALFAGGTATIVLMLILTVAQASVVARMDASVQLRDAPLVEITSKSQTLSGILMSDETNLDIDQLANRFKLVHVGHRFAYVRPPEFSRLSPEDAEFTSGGPYQYAIPVTEITNITQVEEQD